MIVSGTSTCIGTSLINIELPMSNCSDFTGTTYIITKSTGAGSSYLSADESTIASSCVFLAGSIRGSAAEKKWRTYWMHVLEKIYLQPR